MNGLFLALIAVPLGAYLLLLLVNTRNVSAEPRESESRAVETSDDTLVLAPARVENAPIEAEAVVVQPTIQAEPVDATLELKPQSATEAAVPFVVTAETRLPAESTPIAAEVQPAPESVAAVVADDTSAVESVAVPPTGELAALAEQGIEPVTEPAAPFEPTLVPTALELAPSEQAAVVAPVQQSADTASPTVSTETIIAETETPIEHENEPTESKPGEPLLPAGPVILPGKETPKYAFDYRGRLWVEKKQRGFFRQLRRPLLPPDDPPNNSGH